MNAIIKSAIAKLGDVPCGDAQRLDEALHGWSVKILSQAGDFYYVQTSYNYRGYVSKNDLELAPPSAYAAERTKAQIVHNFADALAKPDLKSEVLTSLPRGSFVSLVEQHEVGNYNGVVLADGRSAYIRKNFIERLNGFNMREDELRKQITKNAMAYLETQYRWGGKTAMGIDCSGLTFMAYHLCGINIWRDAYIKEGCKLQKIDFENAKAGDLLYFPGHVAMLLEDGRIIHSTDMKNKVVVQGQNDARELLAKMLYCGTIFP